jgi:5-methylcytosine-specific restriction endonuclease McrA
MHTLVLNSSYSPHRIVSWQEAICLVVTDKAMSIENYDEQVSSPSMSMALPAVIVLRRGSTLFKKGVKFSRINVFTRDEFRCQYCGNRKAMKDLNYDHVIPRRAGGTTNWDNIVTSCYPCNDHKAGRTPAEAGMKLLRQPKKPERLPLGHPILGLVQTPPEWTPYLSPHAPTMGHG